MGQNELAVRIHKQPGSRCFGARSVQHNSISRRFISIVQHHVLPLCFSLGHAPSTWCVYFIPRLALTDHVHHVCFWTSRNSQLSFLSASVHPSFPLLSETIPASSPLCSSLSSIFMQMMVEGVTVLNANELSVLPHQATM